MYNGTTLSGDNKATNTEWYVTFGYDVNFTYGSSSDGWNAGLTASEINSSGFGVYISANNPHNTFSANAYVDHVEVEVFYTEPTSAASSSHRVMFLGI